MNRFQDSGGWKAACGAAILTHPTLWIEYLLGPKQRWLWKDKYKCSGESEFVHVEREWSVFYDEVTRQLSSS